MLKPVENVCSYLRVKTDAFELILPGITFYTIKNGALSVEQV